MTRYQGPFVVYEIFQHYIFNMESRHLLNLSVQNALDCISENFNLKNFPGVACARLEKCAVSVRSPIALKHKFFSSQITTVGTLVSERDQFFALQF